MSEISETVYAKEFAIPFTIFESIFFHSVYIIESSVTATLFVSQINVVKKYIFDFEVKLTRE